VVRQGRIEIIDLEKDCLTVGLERPEIMLFVWIIGVAKIVIHRDGFDDAVDSLLAKRSDLASISRKLSRYVICAKAMMRNCSVQRLPIDYERCCSDRLNPPRTADIRRHWR
jgi:hypothetical protein